MKTFSLMAAVLALGLALATGDADAAKRLGGGKSTGMQRQSTQVDKTPTATPAQTPASTAAAPGATNPAAAAAAAPKRSWMGPLAGLAAGLGLAALASHLGFGEELASMLMIGLAVMAVLAVVGLVMRKRAASQQPAMAGAGATTYGGLQTPTAQRGYDVSMPTSAPPVGGSMIGANLAPATPSAIPEGFDVAGFERNAKVQFIRLQAANDSGNLDDIRAFTTPEMFAELRMDIDDRHGAAQKTDVVTLRAEVLEVVEEGQQHIASVRFTGSTQDGTLGANPEAFDEVWHLTKPVQGQGGWLLSGIQQR
jgi:predicted lipid-binding transport protein (Tim44 family)